MLVVDDEPRNRKLLESYLRSEGYGMLSCADGPTALTLSREHLPDVILLDVMMPEMTGHEVCRMLKGDPKTRNCQVMMVTALTGTANTVEGLDTGADDYVSKPVRREEFLAKVRALIRASGLLRDLATARDTLAARNDELQLKKTLAQTLVHDLKNPLTTILGNLELLRRGAAEKVRTRIDRSLLSASRMLKMVMNLLDVEKLEEGKFRPQTATVNAVDIAVAAVEEAEVTAQQRKVALQLKVPDPAWVDVDSDLLRRVVDNLIANAITHSPSNSVVQVVVCNRPEGVELTISDAGHGVPEEAREEVFEKYSQLDPADASRSFNKGLGLTFCRLAVEAHGGTIWVDSAAGGGACFHTLLPDACPEDEPRGESVEPIADL